MTCAIRLSHERENRTTGRLLVRAFFKPPRGEQGALHVCRIAEGGRQDLQGRDLLYFAVAGVQAISILDFSVWLSYMGQHAVYALAWPIVVQIEINSERAAE